MLKQTYIGFYLEGRNAKPLKHEINVGDLATSVISSGDGPLTVALAAAARAAEPYQSPRYSSKWVRDRSGAIATAGGDAATAYQHYVQGRIDELAVELDALVCEELEGGEEDEDEDEDHGDGEDDDDDDDEGEGA